MTKTWTGPVTSGDGIGGANGVGAGVGGAGVVGALVVVVVWATLPEMTPCECCLFPDFLCIQHTPLASVNAVHPCVELHFAQQ